MAGKSGVKVCKATIDEPEAGSQVTSSIHRVECIYIVNSSIYRVEVYIECRLYRHALSVGSGSTGHQKHNIDLLSDVTHRTSVRAYLTLGQEIRSKLYRRVADTIFKSDIPRSKHKCDITWSRL